MHEKLSKTSRRFADFNYYYASFDFFLVHFLYFGVYDLFWGDAQKYEIDED